ncbi:MULTISPECIES: hypothetical protein [Bradyrhizobium]|uniref:hypothetical protein n=1 Tax=Bradyrhizobium TaxID=374 RepID=UPI001B8A52B6|nr:MULTISPECIES: hypothetical protein [Bradyrhizobium]MBR0970611.1 hypothetical protein [Bradyrhizobium japonicum]
MTKSETSKNEHSAILLDDAALETVVGGSTESMLQSILDSRAVGGWTMRDVFARPVLGQYIPH